MAKNLKINIKNAQIAEAINLGQLKSNLAAKKAGQKKDEEKKESAKSTPAKAKKERTETEDKPKIRARSKSAFQTDGTESSPEKSEKAPVKEEKIASTPKEEVKQEKAPVSEKKEEIKTPLETAKKTPEKVEEKPVEKVPEIKTEKKPIKTLDNSTKVAPKKSPAKPLQPRASHRPVKSRTHTKDTAYAKAKKEPVKRQETLKPEAPKHRPRMNLSQRDYSRQQKQEDRPARVKLGPTGRHVKDLLPKKPVAPAPKEQNKTQKPSVARPQASTSDADNRPKKGKKFKEFKDIKPGKKQGSQRFDSRDKLGLRSDDEGGNWRRRRKSKANKQEEQEDLTIRPKELSVRLPITIKDLAVQMKLKSSQLIAKLFLQGSVYTLNDHLEDETAVQLLGHEFECDITIDTTEEERIRITGKTIQEEIAEADQSILEAVAPVVAFMGHVDHGKTSLIDNIRSSNIASGESGAITQHIGAFKAQTAVGPITILDTPGHEAFSAMRARGAEVTDIVVLVIAGDEGVKVQTEEAIQHAKASGSTIVVAINKCDKPNFNAENVYRQLADNELLPEAWGGETITVNCSAISGEGIDTLLEMLALQAEVLELKANPKERARGSVIESEMNKGLGIVATLLVQNGTLERGDAIVFGHLWGRVKTMRDEFGRDVEKAPPSTPVEITGLSGLPTAGDEFIVVKSEKEARAIAEAREEEGKQHSLKQKRVTMENLFQQAAEGEKKVLNVILRADVQGSLEALKVALLKIDSDKVDLNCIFTGVGEISEQDVNLAAASKAVIIGFHTQVEAHAEPLIKQTGAQIRLHDIIYHAIDDVKLLMAGQLDKIAQEEDRGKTEVKALFKSSQVGIIAGCQVIEGFIHRNHHIRVMRGDEKVWAGTISSLKRMQDDVREVQKGFECGVVLNGCNQIQEGDIIESYEITYISQEL